MQSRIERQNKYIQRVVLSEKKGSEKEHIIPVMGRITIDGDKPSCA